MAEKLSALLARNGLFQLGYFEDGVFPKPFLLRLDLLPAYPIVLQALADSACTKLDMTQYERIVSTSSAWHLGLALALKTGIPLVYAQNIVADPIRDLVGAYDVGHPTLLIATWPTEITPAFLTACGRVGLEIKTKLTLISIDEKSADVETLLVFRELIDELRDQGLISPIQANAVLSWLAENGQKTSS